MGKYESKKASILTFLRSASGKNWNYLSSLDDIRRMTMELGSKPLKSSQYAVKIRSKNNNIFATEIMLCSRFTKDHKL